MADDTDDIFPQILDKKKQGAKTAFDRGSSSEQFSSGSQDPGYSPSIVLAGGTKSPPAKTMLGTDRAIYFRHFADYLLFLFGIDITRFQKRCVR
jgi:hypothetical protein